MLRRQLHIVKYIERNPYASLKQIFSYLEKEADIRDGLTSRTFSRDIESIGNNLNIVIEYDNLRRGYFIDDDEIALSFFRNVFDGFYFLNALDREKELPNYIIPEKRRASTGIEHFDKLRKAIEQKKRISFVYKKYQSSQDEVRIFEPYALKESRGRWYVLGFDENAETAKSFALDRIRELEMLQQSFQPRTMDWKAWYEHSFAMFSKEGAPERIKLSFDQEDGKYLESLPLHHSQKTHFDNDRCIVELNMHITPDLIMEIMSRTWSVEVIEPISLRETFREYYRGALARNG